MIIFIKIISGIKLPYSVDISKVYIICQNFGSQKSWAQREFCQKPQIYHAKKPHLCWLWKTAKKQREWEGLLGRHMGAFKAYIITKFQCITCSVKISNENEGSYLVCAFVGWPAHNLMLNITMTNMSTHHRDTSVTIDSFSCCFKV